MPNHVTNILTIHGSDEQVRAVRDRLANRVERRDSNGKPNGEFVDLIIDFDKLIPMPPEMHITSDGLVSFIENQFSRRDTMAELIDLIQKSRPEVVENFCHAVRNLQKHGFACWYSWAVEKWGTKWGAYSIVERAPNEIKFETAWSHPAPVFAALSAAFPDVRFEVRYADEDIGRNLGHFEIFAGAKKDISIIAPGTDAAKAFAFDVTGKKPYDEDEE